MPRAFSIMLLHGLLYLVYCFVEYFFVYRFFFGIFVNTAVVRCFHLCSVCTYLFGERFFSFESKNLFLIKLKCLCSFFFKF